MTPGALFWQVTTEPDWKDEKLAVLLLEKLLNKFAGRQLLYLNKCSVIYLIKKKSPETIFYTQVNRGWSFVGAVLLQLKDAETLTSLCLFALLAAHAFSCLTRPCTQMHKYWRDDSLNSQIRCTLQDWRKAVTRISSERFLHCTEL